MSNLSKKDIEYITSMLKKAEEISRNASAESFLYSDDMYIGRNDSCKVALHALKNKDYYDDLGEEQFHEIIFDELELLKYYLSNEEFEIKNRLNEDKNSKDSIGISRLNEINNEILYIKQLLKKIWVQD
ncbi:conserved hypothetical protein [Methanococcus vannielii SB]|jgi:hypothetical protein|uniref:Uncharacterized protein n=1 Tax=Methanococcus vannielii (strain ATCC 35089 / DSM 1224 / JCM 13029 / OCM 148 / SB) TaxID=406327 RepID=A6UN82_METVS|nr:hypothetical protein [Methanococcus vannielii]ABR53954.1 conserved hypothetical protein [Methanococcus vannielii SB]